MPASIPTQANGARLVRKLHRAGRGGQAALRVPPERAPEAVCEELCEEEGRGAEPVRDERAPL